MIGTLAHWERRFTADGVAFCPPDNPSAGVIRVRDRLRPLRRLRDIVDEAIASSGSWFASPTVGALDRLTTAEGESAGMVTLTGRVDDAPAERSFGMVVGDDMYSLIDTLALDGERLGEFRDQARELLAHIALGLGAARWRRFAYQPPPGWQGLRRGLAVEWYPLAFPAEYAMIAVPPAKPAAHVEDEAALFADRLLHENSLAAAAFSGVAPPPPPAPGSIEVPAPAIEPIETDRGLIGTLTSFTSRMPERMALASDTAVLEDGEFVYMVRLECLADRRQEYRALLDTVVSSVQKVTRARPTMSEETVTHWVA